MEGTPVATRTRARGAAAAAPPPTASVTAAPSSKRGASTVGGSGAKKRARGTPAAAYKAPPSAAAPAPAAPPPAAPRMVFFTSSAQEAALERMEARRFAPVQAAYDQRVAAEKKKNPKYIPKYTARAGYNPLPLRFDVDASGAATLVADGPGGGAFGPCPGARQAGGGVFRIDLDFSNQVAAFQVAAVRGYSVSFQRGKAIVYCSDSTDQMASLTDAASGATLEAWDDEKLDIAFM